MKKEVPVNKNRFAPAAIGVLSAVVLLIVSGCARYAPVPPPAPKDKILTITLYTEQDVTDEFYYYIAFDIPSAAGSEGPYPDLSGEDMARNWDYYVLLKDRLFFENVIRDEEDIWDEPTIFGATSDRYYDSYLSGNIIRIRVQLNQIRTGNFNFKLNFITSREPLNPDEEYYVDVIDYLEKNTVFSISSEAGSQAYSAQYPNINTNVTDPDDLPADIVNWILRIDEI